MLKKILSVVAGVVAGTLVVMAGDYIGHLIYPAANIDFNNREAVLHLVASIPLTLLISMQFYWLLSSFIGALVAAKINPANRMGVSIITGAILLLAAIANFFMIPHPLWMIIVSVVFYIPAAFLGGKMFKGKE